jgi:hypothetical protein
VIWELLTAVATGVVGASGSDAGMISREIDGEPVPTLLRASTLTLYLVPVTVLYVAYSIVN